MGLIEFVAREASGSPRQLRNHRTHIGDVSTSRMTSVKELPTVVTNILERRVRTLAKYNGTDGTRPVAWVYCNEMIDSASPTEMEFAPSAARRAQ